MLDIDLRGLVAHVTGGGRGIGLAIAQALAAAGADVAISGRNLDLLVVESDALRDRYGVRSLAIECDQTDAVQVASAYRAIKSELGGLNILVNNAGVMVDAPLGMITPEILDANFRTNAYGPINHIQQGVKLLRKANPASIVNLGSIVGESGSAGQVPYAGAKAAVAGITRASAKELAHLGITVNAVAPGFVVTDLTKSLPEGVVDRTVANIALGRAGQPADVSGLVVFLSSPLARYITGQIIGVDGGMLV